MLIAESSPEELALGGVVFLTLGIALALVGKYWFDYVASRPPLEGSLAHKNWVAAQKATPFYRGVIWILVFLCGVAGLGMLAYALASALN